MTTCKTKLVSEIMSREFFPAQTFGVMDFAHDLERVSGLCISPRDKESSWVYRKNDTYALGWIGYGMWQDRAKNSTYVVYSPYIKNNKYKHGDRMNMAMSTSRPNAVKNAMKYLRPLLLSHIISQSRIYCRSGFNRMRNEVEEKMRTQSRDLERNLFPVYGTSAPSALRRELEHLVNSGYSFLDPAVGEQLSSYFRAVQEVSSLKDRSPKFTFVEVTPDAKARGGAKLRVVENHDVDTYMWDATNPDLTGDVYHAADAPEDILHRVAALSMVKDDHYVEGVGYRVCDRIFYLR